MTKKVYCYVRFSSKKQQLGDSIERQEKLIETYLRDHGAMVAEQFSDLGVSAFRGKNVKVGALSRFLERVRLGEISCGDTLIVESLDRISRQKELNTLEIIIAILNAGVIIYTLSDGRIYNAASEDQANLVFQINFIISRAYDESLTKQKRSISAWKRKHEQARSSQKVMTRKLPYWLRAVEDGGELRVEVIEARAKEVKLAFELAKYKLGAQAIASKLNKDGAEKRWTLIAVRHLLKSKSVYGTFEVFKTKSLSGELAPGQAYEEIENYYPAVIDKNDYYSVQSVLQKNKEINAIKGRTPKGFRNVFKGLIKCMDCGSFLHQNFLKRKGKEYMYLVCSKSLVNACPAGKKVIVPYRHILEPFLLLFKNYGVDRLFEASGSSNESSQRLISIKQEIQEKTITIEKMLSDIESNQGEIPRSIMILISKLETKLLNLENEYNELAAELALNSNSAEMRDEITRTDLDEMLEDENGRLRFNALLSDSKIEILLQRGAVDEYSSLFIMFSRKGFSENIRFNRREAIIPLRGTYNFSKKTFSSAISHDGPKNVSEIDYSAFEIDWSL
ncbi:serine recombinase [Pseudomonas putida]|uniref:recombinase family protein n=1 Tax=Pseudomonas putida TaxID=303 RepID=UPI00235CCAD4|nr:recombinase family protein [Pseudomonas putida]GLO06417.1 serine recombinase [Pseudomonas putida]HDS0986117.1 recombinase family protein [Pseudomonas putida]